MMSKILLLAILMNIIHACTERPHDIREKRQKIYFSSFEITYRGGSFGGISFYVDSNRIFFSPTIYPKSIEDSVKYGILPDSIFQNINNIAYKIESDTTIKSFNNHCDDCSVIAIQSVNVSDTIKLIQSGNISKPILDVIHQLETFIDRPEHKYFNSIMILETSKMILPSLPKIED